MTSSLTPAGIVLPYTIIALVWWASSAALAIVWLRRGRPRAFLAWPVQAATLALGMTLVVLRGTIPEPVSVMAGNGLLGAGALLGLSRLHTLVGGRPHQPWAWLALPALLAYLAVFYWIHPAVPLRILGVTVFMAWVTSLAVLDLRSHPDSRRRPSVRVLSGAATAFVAALLVEAFMIVFLAPRDVFYSGKHRWMVLVGVVLFSVTLVVALVTAPARSGGSSAGSGPGRPGG